MASLLDLRWILGAVGLGLFYWLFLRPSPPLYYHRQHQSDLSKFIQSAFWLLRPGAVIHIQHEDSPRRLRLRKLVLPDDRNVVRFELPSGVGCQEHEAAVRTALSAAGFTTRVPEPLDRLWPAREPALLIVDELSATDAFRAVEVARGAMGLSQDALYTMHLEGIPSVSEARKYRRAHS